MFERLIHEWFRCAWFTVEMITIIIIITRMWTRIQSTTWLEGSKSIIDHLPRTSVSKSSSKKFSIRFNRKPWSYGSFNGIRVQWNLHHKLAAKNLHITMITAFPHNPKLEATIISSRPHSFCSTLCSHVWKSRTTIPDAGNYFITRVSGNLILVLFSWKHFIRLD